MLSDTELLPHLICSPPVGGGGDVDEAGQHGSTRELVLVDLRGGYHAWLDNPGVPQALWICGCAWTTLPRRPQLHRANISKH